jgi:hypothetical protein
MVPGTIFFDPAFRFHDGKTGRKLFVLLNDGQRGTYTVVKTTSKDSRYGFVYGCQILCRHPHFYLPRGSCCLPEHTWLCLEEFYEFDRHDLIARVTDTRVNRMGVLPDNVILEVLACAISCDDISATQAQEIRSIWEHLKKRASG